MSLTHSHAGAAVLQRRREARGCGELRSPGAGPRRVFVSLGYASWGKGQLESELAENSWLTVEARADIIFDTPIERRYDEALGLLGLQSWMISPEAGHS